MNSLALYGTRGTIVNGEKRIDAAEYLPERTYRAEFPGMRGHHSEMVVMLQHMAQCVLEGVKPWVGALEGARVVSTGLACWQSLREGVAVKVRNHF